MAVFAYARVSTQDQNIARQLDESHNYDIDENTDADIKMAKILNAKTIKTNTEIRERRPFNY